MYGQHIAWMMTTMADVSVLEVLLYNDPIGTLTRLEGDRSIFTFNESYIADENRSVLGLRFKDPYGELITDFKLRRLSIMPYFSNLLPEGHMRTYLAEGVGVNSEREFFCYGRLGWAFLARSRSGQQMTKCCRSMPQTVTHPMKETGRYDRQL